MCSADSSTRPRYGATESCAAGTRSYPQDSTSAGTVGPPGIGLELKLVDVPSLGYSTDDKPHPRGEICMRGEPIFKKYYKGSLFKHLFGPVLNASVDEKNTKAALDEEGWLHTGDVGEFDSHGRFKIIDRVKVCTNIELE